MPNKTRRRQKLFASEDGSSLLIAVLLVMGLSVFGFAVLMQSSIEDMLSLHDLSGTQAILAADAAVELSVPWLSYDHRNDPNGWSNAYLLTPAPQGSWPLGLLQDDANGTITGVPDTFYYDLRDADSDGTPDQVVPALTSLQGGLR